MVKVVKVKDGRGREVPSSVFPRVPNHPHLNAIRGMYYEMRLMSLRAMSSWWPSFYVAMVTYRMNT